MLKSKIETDNNKSIPVDVSCNMIIQGDNIKVLHELKTSYTNQVHCIYIDPPYNNGENYHYYSDKENHNNWLINIKKTLSSLHPLLSDDGSIWISIDDKEMHYPLAELN